ncbi:MAG: hypothetical protein LUH56_07600 [Oscillospiraceae bacterium]|nr:hypothetical protein [Oscillospiraceae bacterium]
MKLRKVLSLLVALAMMLEVLPLSLFANDMESMAEYTVSESVTVDASSLADNDELLEGYIEQLFGTGSNSGIMLAATYTGEDALDDVNLEVYAALKSAVANIASGAESSTVITVNVTRTTTDLGVAEITDSETFAAATSAFDAIFDSDLVFNYLMNDCPYELYWYDKLENTYLEMGVSGGGTTFIAEIHITMPVASAYQASGSTTTVDSSKVTAAQTAASYAQSLVSTYSGYSDEEKLEAFKEAICSLVSYETDYASADFGDIWQLVYVFDQDSATNVVCEGYSKAFQYLCDLAGLECITVTGTMSGGTGAGEHMWNVVYLDGVNYLVDVTNSDTGSVGQDGGLFMVCADDADASDETGYTFTVNNQTVSYVYDSTTLDLYPEDYLILGTAGGSELDLSGIVARAEPVTYNGHTYQILYAADLTWDEMEAYCEALGGYLACITTAEEDAFLFDYVSTYNSGYSTMFGFSDAAEEGTWVWVSGEETNYTNWGLSEPNGGESENYAGYYTNYPDGEWNDSATFAQQNNFLIEWDAENVTSDLPIELIYEVSININGSATYSYSGTTLGEGEEFTMWVAPSDENYECVATAVDENGNEIKITYSGTSEVTYWELQFDDDWNLLYDDDGNLIFEEVTATAYNYSFTMPASNVTVTIDFNLSKYSISISDVENGTVKADVTSTTEGETVTITVTPDSGYDISELSVTDSDGNEVIVTEETDGTYTFIMPSSDVTVSATFEAEDTHTITIIAGTGYVDYFTAVLDKTDAAEGETVTLTLTLDENLHELILIINSVTYIDENSSRLEWVDYTDNGDGTYTFTMPDKDVDIFISVGNYYITVASDWDWSYGDCGDCVGYTDSESGKYISKSELYDVGDPIRLTVTLYPDYADYGVEPVVLDAEGNSIEVTLIDSQITQWYDADDEYIGDGVYYTYSFTMPASDVTVSAILTEPSTADEYTITVRDDFNVSYSVPSSANAGDEVTITFATDDSTDKVYVDVVSVLDYDSDGNSCWWEDYTSEMFGGDSSYSYTFTMPDYDVEIYFVVGQYTLTNVVNDADAGTVANDYLLAYGGETVNIWVHTNDGYTLSSLTATDASGNSLSISFVETYLYEYEYSGESRYYDIYEFTMPASDVTITGVFEEIHTHTLTHVEATDATCTEDGNTEYWYCDDCGKYFSDEDAENEITLDDTVVEATGHDYGCDEATFTLSVSAYSLMGYPQSGDTLDITLPYSLSASDDVVLPVSYTLTVNGVTVSLKGSDGTGSGTYTQTVDIGYVAMNYSESGNAMIPQSSTAVSGDIVVTAIVDCSAYGSDCTIDVSDIGSWDFEFGYVQAGATTGAGVNADGMTITKTYESTNVSWTWSDDYSSATATFTCLNDSSHTMEVDATVTSETTDATCTEVGKTVYTATATLNGVTYTDTVTVAIDIIDHTYGEPEWTWVWSETEQTYTVTAKFTCTVCGGTDTETALVTSDTTNATCTATGSTIYTAVVDMDGTAYSGTKTVELPMIPHTEGEAVTENEVAATCTTDGSYDTVVYCSVCGEELSRETVTVPATGLHNYELTYTDPDTGDKTYTCSVCGETKVVKGSSSLTIDCTNYGVCWSEDTLFFHAGSWSSYEIDGGDSFLNALAVDGAILAITRSDESGVVYDGVSNYENFILIDSWYTISPYIWLGTAGHTSADEPSKGIIDCISDDGYLVLYDANEVYNAYVAAGGLKGGDPLLITNASGSYDVTNIKVYYPESVTHTWDDGVVTTEATCTEEGVMTYTCTVCGETKTEAIPAKGHSLEHVEATDATCTTDGNKEYWVCTACGELFSDENGTTAISKADTVVPATGHTAEIQNAKDATCTEDGYTGDEVCTVCGETVTTGSVIPATGHTYEAVVTDPTCTEGGYTTYTCTVCGDTYTADETPATGHTTEIRNAKDATCTEDGYTGDEVCTVCGETVTVGTVIPATGHSYGEPTFEWAEDYSSATATFVCMNDETHVETVDATVTSSTTDPTCEAGGSIVYTATADFNGSTYTDEKTETTPATGHDYVLSSWTWAADYSSATATFVCANDSTHVEDIAATLTSETTEATESTYGKTVYTASVTVDGVTYTSSQIDTDNSVVVDEDCNVYDVEASDTGDSGKYFENDSTASVAIQVDGAAIEIEYDTAVDSEIEISITSGGVTYTFNITVSGSRKSSMISVADVIAEAEATGITLNLSNFEYLTVSSADTSIGAVSILSSTGATEHTYETVTIEPTCYSEGSITYTCTVCGDNYTETLEKIAHTEGEQVIENRVEATRTTDGSYDLVTYCSVCGEEISRETVVIPATGGVDMMTIWLRTPANYTSVNEAIAKANALNPDDYSNFADVTAAIDAINWNLNILCQSIVDGYAKTIETAIASLVPAGMTTEEVVVNEPIEGTNTDTEDDVF